MSRINIEDHVGRKYNRLTLIRPSHIQGRWFAMCECGKEVESNLNNIKQGNTASCGCSRFTNPMYRSKEYSAWNHIKSRCLNSKDKAFYNYGGRGITVCDRWLKFENFFADMGLSPQGTSIDRIDNNGNYEPGNCKWSTWKEQMNNTRRNKKIEIGGETMSIESWCNRLLISKQTVRSRTNRGWDIRKALLTPLRGCSI